MNTFLLNVNTTSVVTTANPIVIDVLVGGVVVKSFTLNGGTEDTSVFVEYSGASPSTLSLQFNAGSGGVLDSVTFNSAEINNEALNVSIDFSAQILSLGLSASVTAAASIYGHTVPTLGSATITGTSGDDVTLQGSSAADIIDGLAGNDRIRGRENDDSITGGAGDDTIFGEDGEDTILGGAGDDLLIGNADNDIIFGEGDDDNISGGDGDDILNGGAGLDSLLGGAGDDVLFGEGNDDFLVGNDGHDLLFGDDGDDILGGGDGNDALAGGNGADRLSGGNGGDLFSGGAGNDEIFGEAGDDTIDGDAGDDLILGGAGLDIIDGGDDNDTIVLLSGDFVAGEDIDGGAGTDILWLYGDLTVDITTGTVAGMETLTGSSDDQTVTIDGTTLNQFTSIDFDGGTDFLNLNSTSTSLNGLSDVNLAGLESIDATGAAAGVTITLSAQTESFAVTGSGDDDVLTGGSAADLISGAAGDDTITGGDGADALNGGAGDDIINLANGDFATGESIDGGSETGADRLVLTNATTVDFTTGTLSDIETLEGSSGIDDVTYTVQQALGFSTIDFGGGSDISRTQVSGTVDVSALGTPTVSNAEDGYVQGSGGADTLTITGAQLDALLYGSGTLDFGAGADRLNLNTTSANLNTLGAIDGSILGLDDIRGGSATGNLNINLSGQSEDFTLFGGGFNDTLTGGTGDDSINGEAGDDTITGGAGADTLNGGAGDDTINLANGDFATGESINGGANSDTVVLTDATTVDFTTGTFTAIETLTGSSGVDDLTVSTSMLESLTTLNLAGGATDSLTTTFSGTYDATSATFATISNTENRSLVGSSGNDTLTISATELDDLVMGTGTIDFGAGTADTLNLDVTSTNFNSLGLTDGSILGLENIDLSSASGAITIDLSGQTEGFTVDGGSVVDTITAGSGADTIDTLGGNDVIASGGGVDVVTAGAGDDTITASSYTTGAVTLLNEAFATSLGGFTYADGGFGGSDPTAVNYARGAHDATSGDTANGSAQLTLGGVDNATINDISGNISESFTTTTDTSQVTLTFSYRVFHTELGLGTDDFDNGENLELHATLNGNAIGGTNGNDYFDIIIAPSNSFDSGWVSVSFDLGYLDAGTYTLALGGLITRKTFEPEELALNFDDITISGTEITGGDDGANTFSGGTGADDITGDFGADNLYGVDSADSALATTDSGSTSLLSEAFATNLGGFTYADGGYGGSDPTAVNYARGAHLGTDGNVANGSAEIILGGVDNADISDISGNISNSVTLASAVTDASLNFSYRVLHTALGTGTDDFDTGEDLQLYADFNGTQLDNGTGNGYFREILAPDRAFDTDWISVSFDLGDLSAGTYNFSLGGLLTLKTFAPEELAIRFDDISILAQQSVTSTGTTNTINGSGGADILHGSTETDIFEFDAITAFSAIDQINNFDATEGDAIDISDVLDFDSMTDSIADFVSFTVSGSNTLIAVNADGAGEEFTTIAQVNGLTDMSLFGLFNTGGLIAE